MNNRLLRLFCLLIIVFFASPVLSAEGTYVEIFDLSESLSKRLGPDATIMAGVLFKAGSKKRQEVVKAKIFFFAENQCHVFPAEYDMDGEDYIFFVKHNEGGSLLKYGGDKKEAVRRELRKP